MKPNALHHDLENLFSKKGLARYVQGLFDPHGIISEANESDAEQQFPRDVGKERPLVKEFGSFVKARQFSWLTYQDQMLDLSGSHSTVALSCTASQKCLSNTISERKQSVRLSEGLLFAIPDRHHFEERLLSVSY